MFDFNAVIRSEILVALIKSVVLVVLTVLCLPVQAGGGGGATGLGEMVFTVNVGSNQYLNVGIVLEGATPEASATLGAWKPRLQHEIIMLLSGRDVAELRSLAGKKALMEALVETANAVIKETPKTGVHEALFTKFIIQ